MLYCWRMEKLRQRHHFEHIINTVAPGVVQGIKHVEGEEGSHFNTQEKTIQLQERKTFLEAYFVAGHEGGHAKITKNAEQIGVRKDMINRLYSQLGFAYGLNVLEDGADNDYLVLANDNLKSVVAKVYDDQFASEDAALQTPETVNFCKTYGFVPQFVQFGSNLLRYWHQKRYSENLTDDSPVKQALLRVQSYADRFIAHIPDPSSDDAFILDQARERFAIFVEHVWDEMNALVKNDLNSQAARELLKQMIDAMQPSSGGGESSGQPPFALDQLPPDLQAEILKKAISSSSDSSMSQGLEQALKEIIDSLPPDAKQTLEDKAKQSLESLEDALNEPLMPHHSDQPTNSHQERRQKALDEQAVKDQERIAQEEQIKAEARAKETAQKIAELLRAQAEVGKTNYDRARERVLPYIQAFVRDIEAILIPNSSPSWQDGFDSGGRVSMKKAFAWEGSVGHDVKPFQRKEGSTDRDYRFHFLVDLSGSMRGANISATFDTVVFLYEALTRLNLPFKIDGFQDELIPLVSEHIIHFNPSLAKANLGAMVDEVTNSRQGGHNRANYNDDGYILQVASAELRRSNESARCLVVLSDGRPEPSSAHRGKKYDLKTTINTIVKEQDVYLLGGGVGEGGNYVADYYPHHFTAPNLAELIPRLKKSLTQFIQDYAR